MAPDLLNYCIADNQWLTEIFEKLSIDETNVLLKHLGKDQSVEESMCLADIYNIDVDLIKSTNKGSKIGF